MGEVLHKYQLWNSGFFSCVTWSLGVFEKFPEAIFEGVGGVEDDRRSPSYHALTKTLGSRENFCLKR